MEEAEHQRRKIAVAGAGYVGIGIAALLARRHSVFLTDIAAEKIDTVNRQGLPLEGSGVERFFSKKELNLTATLDPEEAYRGADYVVIAVPTDFDPAARRFDTSAVEAVMERVDACNPDAVMVIKSTVPVGYTETIRKKLGGRKLLHCPEFLRESKALYDNLFPSRIVIGTDLEDGKLMEAAQMFAELLQEGAVKENIDTRIMGFSEAEAVKLFSNTYLALRVSFFNELDTFAEVKGLDTRQIIDGMGLDPRIGAYYNNPSFGYGGYCLPKDTRQLLADCEGVPENLIEAVVQSNRTRKDFITGRILDLAGVTEASDAKDCTVGVYRLIMKSGSDNCRRSSVHGIMERLLNRGVSVIIYEPVLAGEGVFLGGELVRDLAEFKARSRVIIANRWDSCLEDVKDKLYTRDIFQRD
jgi:UDPglucose 6-dehydrogenase